MKIGVSGSSGVLGASILRYLAERAPDATRVGISRTPDKTPTGVEARFGDYDSPDSLAAAYAGLDRLIIIPTIDMRPGARTIQHEAAARAAVKAGVGHIVFLSSEHTRPGPLNTVDDCYFVPEQTLMRTAQRWSILRMSLYAEYFVDRAREAVARGVWIAGSQARVSYVARDDLAAAAAGLLATEGHHGAIYTATGPEALTQDEKASIITKAVGKEIPARILDQAAYAAEIRASGMHPMLEEIFWHHELHTARGGFAMVNTDVAHLAGRPAQRIRDFLAAHF